MSFLICVTFSVKNGEHFADNDVFKALRLLQMDILADIVTSRMVSMVQKTVDRIYRVYFGIFQFKLRKVR